MTPADIERYHNCIKKIQDFGCKMEVTSKFRLEGPDGNSLGYFSTVDEIDIFLRGYAFYIRHIRKE
jgi:hypothetical protein